MTDSNIWMERLVERFEVRCHTYDDLTIWKPGGDFYNIDDAWVKASELAKCGEYHSTTIYRWGARFIARIEP